MFSNIFSKPKRLFDLHHVIYFAKTSELHRRADGREARHRFGWHWRGVGRTTEEGRLRQGNSVEITSRLESFSLYCPDLPLLYFALTAFCF